MVIDKMLKLWKNNQKPHRNARRQTQIKRKQNFVKTEIETDKTKQCGGAIEWIWIYYTKWERQLLQRSKTTHTHSRFYGMKRKKGREKQKNTIEMDSF